VIGWFAPLFGISLLGFLVIDAVLGRLNTDWSQDVRSVNRP
jgi:hypothetical protein